MTLNEYQKLAARTINKDLTVRETELHALHGLTSEVGEIHAIYQKVYQGHPFDISHVMSEAGDLLWFLAELVTCYGYDLEDIAKHNIDKLRKRYPNRFEAERSLNREEGDI